MARITRAEREMEQLLQLAGLRDDLRKVTAERDQLRTQLEALAETLTRGELQRECGRLRAALTQILEYDTFENSRDPRTLMAKEALR